MFVAKEFRLLFLSLSLLSLDSPCTKLQIITDHHWKICIPALHIIISMFLNNDDTSTIISKSNIKKSRNGNIYIAILLNDISYKNINFKQLKLA